VLHTSSSGTATAHTYVPGVYGSLNGLGPGGLDLPPWGPPVVHLLVTADGYEPVVTEVTLESVVSGGGTDLRGPALVLGKDKAGLEVESPVVKEGSVSAGVTVVLEPAEGGKGTAVADYLCRALVWGGVTSFFTEPIAVCRPEMFSFFSL
jgi:hypothetical protein